MNSTILFLTLKVFSATGGIEKVCRVAGKAFYEYGIEHNMRVRLFSMHDEQKAADNNKYFPTEIFTGFNVRKTLFMQRAVSEGCKSKIVVLSHINLLLAGWLIKKMCPSVKIILLAHGIEVWDTLGTAKKKMLNCCDEIVAVSEYTRDKIVGLHGIDAEKCTVINNCLDPFLPILKNVSVSPALRSRYGFAGTDKIIFTLTRLSAKERYKGYDKVMNALVQIKDPYVKYLIAGIYDEGEKEFIDGIIKDLKLESRVVLAGFIIDDEVPAHFALSDCYVMPSVKEGFGIVFIEAMYYGLPVIAGNVDGSVDALKNGELGLLVNPSDVKEIRAAIETLLQDPAKYVPDHKLLMKNFSYDSYKTRINAILGKCAATLNMKPALHNRQAL
jgi:glycosyltransferase involved in cell wall biosynthesis